MKKILYSLLVILPLLTSCFKDEGNYDYAEMIPPHWLKDFSQSPQQVVAYDGDSVTFDASSMFVWDADSAKRESEVYYEWMINGKVIGQGLKFKELTKNIMQAAGVEAFSGTTPTYGTFNVVEKSTGVKYMAAIMVWFYPRFSSGNWFVLSDNSGTTQLSAVRDMYKSVNGQTVLTYEVIKDAYAEQNEGASIPGRPVSMSWAFDKHFGSQGSITVITDQGAFEMNSENLLLKSMIDGNQFLNGLPENFVPIKRIDQDAVSGTVPATFIATENGNVYTRVMSENYLGGKYLTEPYYIDDKGYSIKKFGNALYSNATPCYDEKNRRIVMASVTTQQKTDEDGNYFFVSNTKMVPLEGEYGASYRGAPVAGFPEGTELLYMGPSGGLSWYLGSMKLGFVALYNSPDTPDKTIIGDFVLNRTSLTPDLSFSYCYEYKMPVKLDEISSIISSGNSRLGLASRTAAKTIFYSYGNKVGFGQSASVFKYTFGEMSLPEIESNITYITLAYYDCDKLFVGCENGDIFIYDITALNNPVLEAKLKVDGKVMCARQLGLHTTNSDKFNY